MAEVAVTEGHRLVMRSGRGLARVTPEAIVGCSRVRARVTIDALCQLVGPPQREARGRVTPAVSVPIDVGVAVFAHIAKLAAVGIFGPMTAHTLRICLAPRPPRLVAGLTFLACVLTPEHKARDRMILVAQASGEPRGLFVARATGPVVVAPGPIRFVTRHALGIHPREAVHTLMTVDAFALGMGRCKVEFRVRFMIESNVRERYRRVAGIAGLRA